MGLRGSCRCLLFTVLLVHYGPRPTRSQLGGGWGREATQSAGSENGPQLGKLSDAGPQLGKLSDTPSGARSEPTLQLEAQTARGQAGAESLGGSAGSRRSGADLGGDMSSFFKKRSADEASGTGFDPSKLAPGGGGGPLPSAAGLDAGSGASFSPSKLAPSAADAEKAAPAAHRESARSSRGQGGASAGVAGGAVQKPRPWETGSPRAESAKRPVVHSGGSGKNAMDTLGDLDSLEQSVTANAWQERAPEEKPARQSWLDKASSWFRGGEGQNKGSRDKQSKAGASSGKKGSKGNSNPMQQTASNAGWQTKEKSTSSKAKASGSAEARSPSRASASASSNSREDVSNGLGGGSASPKAEALDTKQIEEFYRKRNAKNAQGGVGGGSASAESGSKHVAAEVKEGSAPMSSLEPPTPRAAGGEASDRDAAGSQDSKEAGSSAGQGRGRHARLPAETWPSDVEQDARSRGQAGQPAKGTAHSSGGWSSGDANVQGGGSRAHARRRPRPPPVERASTAEAQHHHASRQRGATSAGESDGRRRKRPAPPPLEHRVHEGALIGGQLLLEGTPVSFGERASQLLLQVSKALASRVVALVVAAQRRLQRYLHGFQANTALIMHGGEPAGAHDDLYLSAYRRDDVAKDKYWRAKGKAYAQDLEQANRLLLQDNERLSHELHVQQQVNSASNASLASSQHIVAAIASEKRRLQDELATCQLVVKERDDLVAAMADAQADRDGARQDLKRAQEVVILPPHELLAVACYSVLCFSDCGSRWQATIAVESRLVEEIALRAEVDDISGTVRPSLSRTTSLSHFSC